MNTLNFIPFPILITDRLLLRKLDKSDANEILFLRSDKAIMKYIPKAPATSIQDAVDFIESIINLENKHEGITWAITLKDNPRLCGTICLWNIQKNHYRAEVGYVLDPQLHGKGIMQEALQKVLQYGFEVMKLHSIEALIDPANLASARLLEKNNFIKEAHFKENFFYDGNFLDTVVYSLLAK